MIPQTTTERAAPALAVRARLVEALHLDLVGPSAGHALVDEQLPDTLRPAVWYLTGFLIPSGTPSEDAGDADEEDESESVAAQTGIEQEANDDRRAAKKGYFPSSIGLTFLVPATATALMATFRWGEYALIPLDPAVEPPTKVWQRTPYSHSVTIMLTGGPQPALPIAGTGGMQYQVIERPIISGQALPLAPGTRSVSVFLINHRRPLSDVPDSAYAFQAEIDVQCQTPFVARPNLRGMGVEEWDARVADLHYAGDPEYAVGHGVSADWELIDGACHRICTAWIPAAAVEKTVTVEVPGVELAMDVLGVLADGAAAETALRPLVDAYHAWLADQLRAAAVLPPKRRETAEVLLQNAQIAATRIARGIDLLASSPDALDAFCTANRAVARALKKRLKVAHPRWRAFQLAFVLLNLPGIADPLDPDRTSVDLLFFPTGGGKTEAYLGLAAFAMVLRRLRAPGDGGTAGAGVSVVMRYTLRLLTLDQLGRAAGLVCALELERLAASKKYGTWPFEIGLWVGKAATPNVLGQKGDTRDDTARALVKRFQQHKGSPSPIPLEMCPWCGTRFTTTSFALVPDADKPRALHVVCSDFTCEFSGDRSLPIVAVDEVIYRRLPAFLIATVDKFATLPWMGQSGALLGGADRADAHGFYGAAEPKLGTPLSRPLAPPDLIIQDELHLIAGPLGTMAGLYETAIDALASRTINGTIVGPKIVASTATVRRAQEQILALFARPLTQIFPPPGPDRHDSFFARTSPSTSTPARQYVGIAAQGRSPKVMMRKAWLALMAAAQQAYLEHDGEQNPANPADPYMTVLGYFNNLRELGGARRILEEEVQTTVKSYGARRRINETSGVFADRARFSAVLELTSRVSTDQIAEARRRLEATFDHGGDRVDCALATNMISVGLDIQRLGLMVVVGQPMLTAEYIQATSRVGRDDTRPGLVVTLLNVHKPRDRSHYERFRHYHETFYRSVEASSVTPFSARALDRGFAGALVALARHADPRLTPPGGVMQLASVRVALEQRLIAIFQDRVDRQTFSDADERAERLLGVKHRIVDLLDAWQRIVATYQEATTLVQYQSYEPTGKGKPLLHNMLEKQFESDDARKFRASRSLRDVEPDVNLYLRDLNDQPVEE